MSVNRRPADAAFLLWFIAVFPALAQLVLAPAFFAQPADGLLAACAAPAFLGQLLLPDSLSGFFHFSSDRRMKIRKPETVRRRLNLRQAYRAGSLWAT